jgi:glyoxylase-like metal-dependent hydrolase (beta-lactamase superfamily II)
MHIKIFDFNPVHENTYLLYDETKEAAIIDCGASTEVENEQLTNYIQTNSLKLKYLLNTHLHFDHAIGNYFIYRKYGLKPQYHIQENLLPELKIQAKFLMLPSGYEEIRADNFINDGDCIQFGNTTLKALLTPGHSPGSLSFYCETEPCVFTGDALFRHDIGRTDLWGGNEYVLLNAIRSKLLTLPSHTVVYSGHGLSSTIQEEKEHNPYI